MKLRMLNGSHSSLAYLGYLAGFEFVSEAIGSPALRMFIRDLMTREVIPTLSSEVGDLHAYRDTLLDRFANPAIRHRTWQIAMDGSQKLPQRLLGTIRDCLARDQPISRASLGIAAWMRYVTGIDELREPIDVRDPLAGHLRAIADAAGPSSLGLLDGMLGVREVFGDDLPRSGRFRRTLGYHLDSLFGRGALATIQDVNLRGEFRR